MAPDVQAAQEYKRYLRPKEIADYFGVTLSTVRRWVNRGMLQAVKTPGGHSRIIAKDFFDLQKSGKFAL